MTKLVRATVDSSGVVNIDGQKVEDALQSGVGGAPSSGVALVDGDTVVYIVLDASDLKTLIEKLVEIVGQVATVATGIDAATNSPGGQTAAIAQLNVMKAELEQLGGELQ